MKKFNLLILAMLAGASSLSARGVVAPVGLDSIQFDRQGDYLMLDMDLNLRPTDVASGRAQVITPLIVTEKGDTIALPSVGVYGRQRYINYLRNDRSALSRSDETTFRADERPMTMDYQAALAYADSLNGCSLVIRRRLFGCANCLVDEKFDSVGGYRELLPPMRKLIYIDAEDTGPIIDTLAGSAYIDFIVDKTYIDPNYRRNPQELMRIQASIDTVVNDKDVKITGVWLKGFASPESPYSHNRELAIGRTEALKEHIGQLYDFGGDIIETDFEPEDWAGLRAAVAASNIDNRDAILEIIDSDMAPDPKEALIKKRFPKEYRFMLANFYPALRHTEYRVTYEVKRFDDVDKIREVMRTKPNRLTLREFYILGNACQPGSDEFNEVYETAVRMYPDDPVANINAANAALQRDDLVSAEKYLAKAGDADQAVYARASLAFAKGDYDEAEKLLRTLPDMTAARDLLNEIEAIKKNSSQKVTNIMLE